MSLAHGNRWQILNVLFSISFLLGCEASVAFGGGGASAVGILTMPPLGQAVAEAVGPSAILPFTCSPQL